MTHDTALPPVVDTSDAAFERDAALYALFSRMTPEELTKLSGKLLAQLEGSKTPAAEQAKHTPLLRACGYARA